MCSFHTCKLVNVISVKKQLRKNSNVVEELPPSMVANTVLLATLSGTLKQKFTTAKSKLTVATLPLQYYYSDFNALKKEIIP